MPFQSSSFADALDRMTAAMPAVRLEDCLRILRRAHGVRAVVLVSLATEGKRFELQRVQPQATSRASPQALDQDALHDLLARLTGDAPLLVSPAELAAQTWQRLFRVEAADVHVFLPLRSGSDLIGFLHLAAGIETALTAQAMADRLTGIQAMLARALRQKRAWDLLQNVTDTRLPSAGARVFESATRMLAATLDADIAFIGRLNFDFAISVSTLAACSRDGMIANFAYPLEHCGCRRDGSRAPCCLPTGAEDLRPGQQWLSDEALHTCLALPIEGVSGKILGVLGAMFRRPPADATRIASMLAVFIECVTAELRRIVAEEEREMLSAVVEANPDLVATVLPSGYITYLNPAGRRLLGLTDDAAIVSLSALFGERPSVKAFIERILEYADEHGSWREDGVLPGVDGRPPIEVAHTITPIRDAAGRPHSYAVVTRDISHRKAQESHLRQTIAALSQSESLLDGIVSNSGSLIYVKDLQGVYLLANESCAALSGRSRREVVGKTDHELHSREVADSFRCNDLRVVESGKTIQFEEVYDAPTGRRVLLTVKFPLLGLYDRPYAVCGISTDITDRNRDLEEKLASERKFRAVFDGANDAIFLLRGDRFTDCNDKALELYACAREDVIGLTPAMLSPPCQPDGSRSDESSTLRIRNAYAGQEQRFEWRGLRADGQEIDLEVSVNRVQLNQETHLLALVRDISDRKQAEQRLADVLALNSTIIEVSSLGIIAYRSSGECVLANEAAARIVGASVEQLLAQNFRHVPAWRESGLLELANRVLATGEAVRSDLILNSSFGREVWLEGDLVPFSSGGERHLLGIMSDVTERKRAEREQLELEAKLRQAQKMESIGQLSGGIAHDFNNILAAVLGFTELAQMETPTDSKLGGYLNEIQRASLRARDLVAQLLAFSRRSKPSSDLIRIAPVVTEVVKLLSSTLPRTISITADVSEALPMIRISPVYLHQVLMNLCINARDAMPGGGRLEVRATVADIDDPATCTSCQCSFQGTFLVLSVRDEGQGMPAGMLPHIFDPFFTSKAVGQGSGLGLSVLHGIVHSAGGHVEVASVPGKGSEFRIYFPAVRESPAADELMAETRGPRSTLKGRILVVDDEEQIVATQRQLLAHHGCVVDGFTDPKQALAVFREYAHYFDLVITDQTMPGMTGSELARAIADLRPEVPVVLCTGYLSEATAESARALGIRQLLEKPVPAAMLLQTVEELLR